MRRESSDIYARLDSEGGEENEGQDEEEEEQEDTSAEEKSRVGAAISVPQTSVKQVGAQTLERAFRQSEDASTQGGETEDSGGSEGDCSEQDSSDDEVSKLADFDPSFHFTAGLDFRNKGTFARRVSTHLDFSLNSALRSGLGWGTKKAAPKVSIPKPKVSSKQAKASPGPRLPPFTFRMPCLT
jgi:hypothetical protein